FRRDGERFQFAAHAAQVMPLGAGALAGVNFETDRDGVAEDLGFTHVAQNSLDAVSNRDFVLDYLSAAAVCATHLSQLGAEIVLWTSEEFGFAEVSDAFASGSSIMPQKKNPDAAELLRAKAPRVAGHLVALHGVFHGLPLTYNKDMQEDKEHLFDAMDTVELSLAVAAGMLRGIEFRRERLAAAAADDFLAATDVADLLVRRGVPFREAHGIVAGLVRHAVDAVRAARERLRVPLVRHPCPAQRGVGGGGGGRRGADPRARAGGGRGVDAAPARARAARGALLGAGEAHPGPRDRPRAERHAA